MATRINEDIYRDMVESGKIQLSDILPQDYGYVGNIEEDSEFNTPYTTRNRTGILSAYDRLMGPIKRTYQNYGAPLMGTLFGALTGIPGIGFLMRNLPTDPYAQNYKTLADGAYMSSTGLKDKFGYIFIGCSADHYGKKLEYMRYPIDHKVFEENLKFVNGTRCFTLTSLYSFYFTSLHVFCCLRFLLCFHF